MKTEIKNIENQLARRILLMSMIEEYKLKGLGNTSNVVQMKNELAQINFDKYKEKYPSYLFFTDEQFDEIIKRNNIVISNIESYTGFIPDNCFEAVKNEHIDIRDYREDVYTVRIKIKNDFYYKDRYASREKVRAEICVSVNKYDYNSILENDKERISGIIIDRGDFNFLQDVVGSLEPFGFEYEDHIEFTPYLIDSKIYSGLLLQRQKTY